MKLTKEMLTEMVKEVIQEQMEEAPTSQREIYDVNISFKFVLSKGEKIDKDSLKIFLGKVKEFIYGDYVDNGGEGTIVYASKIEGPEQLGGYDTDVPPSHLKISVNKVKNSGDVKKPARVIRSYKK